MRVEEKSGKAAALKKEVRRAAKRAEVMEKEMEEVREQRGLLEGKCVKLTEVLGEAPKAN